MVLILLVVTDGKKDEKRTFSRIFQKKRYSSRILWEAIQLSLCRKPVELNCSYDDVNVKHQPPPARPCSFRPRDPFGAANCLDFLKRGQDFFVLGDAVME